MRLLSFISWSLASFSVMIALDSPHGAQADPRSTARTLLDARWSATPILPTPTALTPAAPVETESITQAPEASDTAAVWVIPRFGGRFTTGPSAGYESSFGSIFGFVPMVQRAGQNLLFAEGKMNVTTEAGNLGGNLRLGYRTLLLPGDLVLGGYLGYDIRDTGNTTFHQVGAGLEALAPGWEVRLNGYLPVGDRRRLVDERRFDSGDIVSAIRFSGNFLTATRNRLQVIQRDFEASMSGFDLEFGAKLLSWQTGNLKAFAGMYFYSAPEMDAFAGFRGRLQAEINQNLVTGLTLESDGKHGTRLIASVGLSFGGVLPQHQAETPAESIAARLGTSVVRQETLGIDPQQELKENRQQAELTFTNPATGQPWRFVHVTPGTAGGNGTFESPFGEIAGNAISNALTDGNNIIYVQGAGTIAGNFTIPDNVQLLSAAVPQLINTTTVGLFQLPGSGTGVYPGIGQTVFMGNNTVISGFAVTPPPGNTGIVANGVRTVTVRDNQIQSNGNDRPGVGLRNVSGIATVNNNVITTTGNTLAFPITADGITVIGSSTALDSLVVNNNQISIRGRGTAGISVLTEDSSAIANVSIIGNTIATFDSTDFGIQITPVRGATITNTSLLNNVISTTSAGAYGIIISPSSNSPMTNTTVSGNTIATSGSNAEGIYIQPNNNSPMTNVAIASNQVTTSGLNGQGIIITNNQNSPITTLSVITNTISTLGNGASGIWIEPQSSTITNATVSGNTINTSGNVAGSASHGIFLPQTASPITNLGVSNNTITTTGTGSIGILRQAGNTTTLTLANNRILQSGAANVQIENNTAQPLCARIEGNLTQNPGGGSVNFNLQSGVQTFRVVNLTTLSTSNNGAIFSLNGVTVPPFPVNFANVATCP